MICQKIDDAREILGDDSNGVSDDQLKREIEAAKFFKDIFFDFLKKGKLQPIKKEE